MNNFTASNSYKRRAVTAILIATGLVISSGCQQLGLENPLYKTVRPVETPQKQLSAAPLAMSADNISFAQFALNKLGYQVGDVDGLWGPRSVAAIRQFEQDQGLTSADGGLSELNLHTLELVSGTDRTSPEVLKTAIKPGIAAKLNAGDLREEIPQLIITEQPYPILARANPYSEVITTLPPGTGLYVLNLQSGWYEVESTDYIHGYIRAD